MPVKNQRYTMRIDGLGADGEGVGRIDGFTMFVEGALPGETVEVLAVKVKKTYGYGKLLAVVAPSPDRVTPVCPVFNRCGGCSLQNLSYAAQLRYKTDKVAGAIKRIAGIDCVVEPTLGMDTPLGYRNKAQFPVRGGADGPVIGFYASRSHRVVEVKDCALQLSADNPRVLAIVENFMRRHAIKPYDESTHTGLIRHVLTRVGLATGESMVCVVINGENLPHAAELARELMQLEGMRSVVININRSRTNVILGERTEVIWGEGFITDCLCGVRLRVSAKSFMQVNPVQAEVLYEKAAELARFTAEDTVVDAYSGIGSISLFIASRVKKVYGIELVPEAVADAEVNARLNDITNAEFICGEAETRLPALISGIRPDVIILDPPRKGCGAAMLGAISQSGVKRLVYVSCDPATMARDMRVLAGGGFGVKAVQPVDLFPMTPHVECVVLMGKSSAL